MNTTIDRVLASIAEEHAPRMTGASRFYREVHIGRQAAKLGLNDIDDDIRNSHAMVLLKDPGSGMKVRIDGRTFVDYAQSADNVVVPGYVASRAAGPFRPYTAEDSMVMVFT